MDGNRLRQAAEWFYRHVYGDEPIQRQRPERREKLPPLLMTARSLENRGFHSWQSREAVFVKQGKLLANYEDDYAFSGEVLHYYPTYESLSDPELRGYFAWRTRLRYGHWEQTSLSFAFLYIYELLNRVGGEPPEEAFQKLREFREHYGALDRRILPYLQRWERDYVVYYDLPPAFLSDNRQTVLDRALGVLDHPEDRSKGEIMEAVRVFAPKWLGRSRFYGENREDMDEIVARFLKGAAEHYTRRTQKTLADQLFGREVPLPVRFFEGAVFYAREKKPDGAYVVDPYFRLEGKNGQWVARRRVFPSDCGRKLEDLMKSLDGELRLLSGYGRPIQHTDLPKWQAALLRQCFQELSEEKKAAEAKKITIDFSALAGIRRDAEATKEKLMVEEEQEDDPGEKAQEVPPEPEPASEAPENFLLTPVQTRFLRCLLYGGSLAWVAQEGYLPSVLADGINEALYDQFCDAVLDTDGAPTPVEDYIDELKEMVAP